MTAEEKLDYLLSKVDKMELQVGRIASDAESEKHNRRRATDDITDILYGKDKISGMVVELDRLKQNGIRAEKHWNYIIGLIISVVVLIIKEVVQWVVAH